MTIANYLLKGLSVIALLSGCQHTHQQKEFVLPPQAYHPTVVHASTPKPELSKEQCKQRADLLDILKQTVHERNYGQSRSLAAELVGNGLASNTQQEFTSLIDLLPAEERPVARHVTNIDTIRQVNRTYSGLRQRGRGFNVLTKTNAEFKMFVTDVVYRSFPLSIFDGIPLEEVNEADILYLVKDIDGIVAADRVAGSLVGNLGRKVYADDQAGKPRSHDFKLLEKTWEYIGEQRKLSEARRR